MSEKTVTISDDHKLIRVGLAAVLSKEPDLRVVGEAETLAASVVLVEALKPDVAIIDLDMTDGSGLTIVPKLRQISPQTRILVLTMHVEPEIVRRALSGGIHGYVNKDADLEDVVRAVRAVASGRSFLGVPVSGAGLANLLQGVEGGGAEPVASPPEASPQSLLALGATALSKRERQVLVLFARGETHRVIAHQLGLSTKTVETYRSRLGHKFGARTRADLARCALALGLIDASEAPATH